MTLLTLGDDVLRNVFRHLVILRHLVSLMLTSKRFSRYLVLQSHDMEPASFILYIMHQLPLPPKHQQKILSSPFTPVSDTCIPCMQFLKFAQTRWVDFSVEKRLHEAILSKLSKSFDFYNGHNTYHTPNGCFVDYSNMRPCFSEIAVQHALVTLKHLTSFSHVRLLWGTTPINGMANFSTCRYGSGAFFSQSISSFMPYVKNNKICLWVVVFEAFEAVKSNMCREFIDVNKQHNVICNQVAGTASFPLVEMDVRVS